jgi:hypothetical protein
MASPPSISEFVLEKQMDKKSLISKMQASRQQFLMTIITIRDQSHDAPVLPQGWSIKDLLAHG